MIRTFAVPFDDHQRGSGREGFGKLVRFLAPQFRSPPIVIDEPIFSYESSGRSRLRRLSQIGGTEGAIVFLSNLPKHASVLIIGECETPILQQPLRYESVEELIDSPYACGYGVAPNAPLLSSFVESTVVVSELVRFCDENDVLPETGLFHVIDCQQDVFTCNVLDYDRFFAHRSTFAAESTFQSSGINAFFLAADHGVSLDNLVEHLINGTLRGFLLDQGIPFATLGDDHINDEYAVSYGMDCWRCQDGQLAFAR